MHLPRHASVTWWRKFKRICVSTFFIISIAVHKYCALAGIYYGLRSFFLRQYFSKQSPLADKRPWSTAQRENEKLTYKHRKTHIENQLPLCTVLMLSHKIEIRANHFGFESIKRNKKITSRFQFDAPASRFPLENLWEFQVLRFSKLFPLQSIQWARSRSLAPLRVITQLRNVTCVSMFGARVTIQNILL